LSWLITSPVNKTMSYNPDYDPLENFTNSELIENVFEHLAGTKGLEWFLREIESHIQNPEFYYTDDSGYNVGYLVNLFLACMQEVLKWHAITKSAFLPDLDPYGYVREKLRLIISVLRIDREDLIL